MIFPSSLTEEEETLQKKFAKLKKKKKAVMALKKQSTANPSTQSGLKRSVSEQPTVDGAAATEQAKKLMKSGAISAIRPETKSSGFKRSRTLEGKLKDPEKEKPPSFQPFQRSVSAEDEAAEANVRRPQVKNLYESFVSGREHENSPMEDAERVDDRGWDRERHSSERREPRRGNTIYVNGSGITDEILQTAFSSIGPVLNVTMERARSCGFVTFEKMESADQAIAEMNGAVVSDVRLRVSLARRQPKIEATAGTSPWSTLALGHSAKGLHQDRRNQVVYSDDPFS